MTTTAHYLKTVLNVGTARIVSGGLMIGRSTLARQRQHNKNDKQRPRKRPFLLERGCYIERGLCQKIVYALNGFAGRRSHAVRKSRQTGNNDFRKGKITDRRARDCGLDSYNRHCVICSSSKTLRGDLF